MTDAPAQPDRDARNPTRSELVDQTLSRFESVKIRSGVLDALSKPDLLDVGMWLTEPGKTVIDAWRLLHVSLGGEVDAKGEPVNPAIPRNNFYRYAERFLDLYSQIKREYANRAARMSVNDATDGNIRAMTQVARNRAIEMIAEKLVTADDIDQVDIGRLASVVAESERAQHNQDKLELDRQNLERQIRETASRLEVAEQRAKLMQQDVERREREIQQSIDAAKKTVQSKVEGGSKAVSADEVIALLDKVMKGEA